MIDCPMAEVFDDRVSLMWLERHLPPGGVHGPRGGSTARRLCHAPGHFPAHRCRAGEGDYPLLTGTVLADNPATTRDHRVAVARQGQGRADGSPGTRVGAVR